VDLIGKRIAEYEILEEIGRGGMGTVYKAKDTALDRIVALKFLSQQFAEKNPVATARFRKEAQAVAKLNSPHVVTIHRVSEVEGVPFIVMEYVEGRELREYLPKERPQLPEVTRILVQICLALENAHSHRILHRDIKPENILVTDEGIAKVMDFGIARLSDIASLTDTGELVGTAAYMSPEQALGESIDERSDLYSLGVVAYEMLTGRLPFEAPNLVSLVSKKTTESPPMPSEIGLEVPPDLESLVMRALERDPDLRPASAREMREALERLSAPPSPGLPRGDSGIATGSALPRKKPSPHQAPFQPVMVARDEELKVIADCLDRAAAGRGGTVLVSGETGSGKTIFLEECARVGESKGCIVLRGSCLFEDSAVPYFPYVAALRDFLRGDRSARHKGRRERVKAFIRKHSPALGVFMPYLETVIEKSTTVIGEESPVPQSGDAQSGRERIFSGISELLDEISGLAPVLLVLDDLQWVDPSSLQLFHYVGRVARSMKLLTVASYRNEELGRSGASDKHSLSAAMKRMRREDLLEEIKLDRLSKADFGRLLKSLLSNHRFTQGFVDFLYQQTAGNPLFTKEMLKTMKEEGIIQFELGAWHCKKEPSRTALPRKILDAVERRIDRLEPQERAVLECASVQGESFSSEVLGYVLKADRLELLRTLQRLERDHQIITFSERDYRFTQPMVWECLYKGISDELRQEYHLTVGEHLERKHKPNLDPVLYKLAEHFYKARDYARALPYLERSYEHASKVYAYEEALIYLQRALQAVERMEAEVELQDKELALRKEVGRVSSILGNWDEALRQYEEARMLASINSDELSYAQITKLMGDVEYHRRNWDRAVGLFDEAKEIFEQLGEVGGLAEVNLSLGNICFEKGDMEQVFAHYSKTLEAGEKLGDPKLVARACNNLGATNNVIGDREKAIWYYGRSLENYRFLGDEFGEAQTYHNIGMTYAELRNWNEAAQFYQKSLDVSSRIREMALISISSLALGEAYARIGRTSDAFELVEKALAIFLARDDKLGVADAYRVMGILEMGFGNTDSAIDHFEQALEIARDRQSLLQVAETCRDYGAGLVACGREEAGMEKLLESREIFSRLGATVNVGELDKMIGELQVPVPPVAGGTS